MHLSSIKIEAIKQEAEHFFGARAEVWLFGSRVDDAKVAALNRTFAAADKLVEILQHVKGFAARYVHE